MSTTFLLPQNKLPTCTVLDFSCLIVHRTNNYVLGHVKTSALISSKSRDSGFYLYSIAHLKIVFEHSLNWLNFFSRPTSYFCALPIQGQTCHGCINNDILVGLYSKLMRFYYYYHLGIGKKLMCHAGIEPGPFRSQAFYSTPRIQRVFGIPI